MELDQMRRECENKLVLIEDVLQGMVSFYEFGPNEDGDLKWTKFNTSAQYFIENTCNQEKNAAADEVLDLEEDEKREMAPGLMIDSEVPEKVKELAKAYELIGLQQPLDSRLLVSGAVDVSPQEPITVYDQGISEAIKKQLSLDTVLKNNYTDLYGAGMTKFPIFVHEVSPDNKISYISLILDDDNTFGFRQRKNGTSLFLTQVKRDLKELISKIEAAAATGWSKPDDYAYKIDLALRSWSDMKPENKELYNKILVNYSPDRLSVLRNSLTTAFGEMAQKEYYSEIPEMNTYFSGSRPSPVDPSNKNVRDLDINELRDRMSTLFGKEYAQSHEPVITFNKFGVRTVQYRKKTGPKPDLEANNWMRDDVPVFSEFGTETDDFELF
tara:strand:- start:1472 stop:2623 length:1152 start_codon:yes stop_codon:yes gene_type:complete